MREHVKVVACFSAQTPNRLSYGRNLEGAKGTLTTKLSIIYRIRR